MSVRVFDTSVVVSLNGVSCVGASEGGDESSVECSDGVLLVRGVDVVVSGEGGGGVVGALNKRDRISLYVLKGAPTPPAGRSAGGGGGGVGVAGRRDDGAEW